MHQWLLPKPVQRPSDIPTVSPVDSPTDSSLAPYRGHATLVTPTLPYSGTGSLKYTYELENGPYLISTPSSGLVFGVGYHEVIRDQAGTHEDVMGATDDSLVPEGIKKCEYINQPR